MVLGVLAHEHDVAWQQPQGISRIADPHMNLAVHDRVNREGSACREPQSPLAVRGGARKGRAMGTGALKQIS
jgi:hypothetical protein